MTTDVIFPPGWAILAIGLVLSAGFVLRTLLVWRRTGQRPVGFAGGGPAMGVVRAGYGGLITALGIDLVLRAFWPASVAALGPITLLEIAPLAWTGLAVAGLGALWSLLALYAMGGAWRVGIPKSAPTELVTGGPFGVSRNPFFFGMLVMVVGFVLAAPDAITLSTAIGLIFTVNVQVRLEEAVLADAFGDAYRDYCRRVRRWL